MIILRVFIGLDTQGTAQAIGIAPGTVGVHLHRALATLHAVTARDAAGDMITETLPAAYRIAPATGDRSTFPTTFSTTAKPPTPPATGTTDPLRNACPKPRPGRAQCFVRYQTRSRGTGVAATARPKGLTPRDIWSAYRLPFRRNLRQTVAIVDAFRTPHLRQYADHYRQQFGLPPCGGCLKIVNQRGQAGPLPVSGARSGWDREATLDVDIVSVACPRCHILVVEASNNSIVNLAASENTAARLGAPVISNSYGGSENGFAMTLAKDYHHPGHTIVVSSGDNGFGEANFPADLATVTAVGGTELRRSGDARGWSESVWNDHDVFGGADASGCSAYVAKPAWQHDSHCPGRTIADVSAVARDIPVYNKVWGGWITVGGTSIAAPLIAGIYGLAGNAARLAPGSVYQHRRELFDIRTGENAFVPRRRRFAATTTCASPSGGTTLRLALAPPTESELSDP